MTNANLECMQRDIDSLRNQLRHEQRLRIALQDGLAISEETVDTLEQLLEKACRQMQQMKLHNEDLSFEIYLQRCDKKG